MENFLVSISSFFYNSKCYILRTAVECIYTEQYNKFQKIMDGTTNLSMQWPIIVTFTKYKRFH